MSKSHSSSSSFFKNIFYLLNMRVNWFIRRITDGFFIFFLKSSHHINSSFLFFFWIAKNGGKMTKRRDICVICSCSTLFFSVCVCVQRQFRIDRKLNSESFVV